MSGVPLGSEQSIQLFCDTECKCVFQQGAAGAARFRDTIAHLFALVSTEAWVVRVSLLIKLPFVPVRASPCGITATYPGNLQVMLRYGCREQFSSAGNLSTKTPTH